MKNENVDYTGVYIVKINKLEKEIERLNNRIEKAIEKINNWNEETSICIEDCYFKEELLEILRGVDKE